MAETNSDPEQMLVEDIARFTHDPAGFVRYAYPWGEGELAGYKGPEDWQMDVQTDIGTKLRAGGKGGAVIRIAVASGHGIGKSAQVAQLIDWCLSTFEDSKVILTANTATQLRTKTWSEMAKWHRLSITSHWFNYRAEAMESSDPKHKETWRADCITWTKERSEAFAGAHNQGKRLMIVFDEASAIDDKIWEVVEGALSDANTEIIWLAFGNPTLNKGRFFDCFHEHKHLWTTRQIDSRNVSLTNKAQLQEQIDTYGIDSDFVKVRILGEFPSSAEHQFIGNDIVSAARGKHLRPEQYNFAPVIIGVDPAWSTDEAVIYLRQGNISRLLGKYVGLRDDVKIAGYIAGFEDEYKADGVNVDLGYGTGIVSVGNSIFHRHWNLIPFGGESWDVGYLNARACMWKMMRDWMREGGAIPDDPVLVEQLCQQEYYICTGKAAGKIALVSKEDMKSDGLSSPNRADALALTFALPIRKKEQADFGQAQAIKEDKEMDPFAL